MNDINIIIKDAFGREKSKLTQIRLRKMFCE